MNTSKETIVGLFVLIGLLCVAYMTIKLGRMEIVGTDGYTLEAKFSAINGLRVGAEVEIAGVPVGKVSSIRLDKDKPLAVVSMRIHKDVQLSDDTIVSVKTSGLIGDKYLNLAPGGSSDLLKNGDMLTETESALDIESLISKFALGGV